jgi:excisionase family DNA binding protein
MRHQILLLNETADALQGEAKERTKPGSMPRDGLEGLWRRCVATTPDQAAAFRALPWKDWILLTALRQGKKEGGRFKWIEAGWITVYFGRAPVGEIEDGRPPKATKRAQRDMRRILRLYAFPNDMQTDLFPDQPDWLRPGVEPPMSRYKVMVIDARTSIKVIIEQLSVIMAQLNLADESVMKFLRLRIQDPAILSSIIAQFADPDHPGSYGEFVKRLRREAARHARKQRAASLDRNQYLEPELIQERARRGKPVKNSHRQSVHPLGLTVWEVAEQTGIPETTIYRWIDSGQLQAAKDDHAVKRIPVEEVLKMQSHRDEGLLWKKLVEIRCEISSEPAARRWVQRKRKQGIDPRSLLKQLWKPANSNRA